MGVPPFFVIAIPKTVAHHGPARCGTADSLQPNCTCRSRCGSVVGWPTHRLASQKKKCLIWSNFLIIYSFPVILYYLWYPIFRRFRPDIYIYIYTVYTYVYIICHCISRYIIVFNPWICWWVKPFALVTSPPFLQSRWNAESRSTSFST